MGTNLMWNQLKLHKTNCKHVTVHGVWYELGHIYPTVEHKPVLKYECVWTNDRN